MSKIVKVQAPDGSIIKVEGPDDATDEQFLQQGATLWHQQHSANPNQAILDAQAKKYPTAAESGNPEVPWYVGMFNRGNPDSKVTQALEKLPGVLENTAPGADTGMDSPAVKLLAAAVPGGAATEGLGLVQGLKAGPIVKPILNVFDRLFPSATRAGAKFAQVESAAGHVPIDTSQAYKVGERAEELAQHGASEPPRPISAFMKMQRPSAVTVGGQPTAIEPPPLTYKAGRDFAIEAGRVSAEESAKMSPSMKAQLAKFAEAMKASNREAAASVGMGDVYDAAMKEFRQAKTLEEAAAIVKKWGVHAVLAAGLGAAGAAAGIKLYHELR